MECFNTRLYELVQLANKLREVHPGCGVEKMYYELKPDWIGRDTFIEIFMEMGYRIRSPHRYKATTIPAQLNYPNLIEGLLVLGINTVWQSDITYYPIGDKFYYLVFINDVYSRRILGYQASDHLRAEANIQSLQMSFNTRDCSLNGLIHHSDRGSQYVNKEYIRLLNDAGAYISMGVSPQENAYVERINGIIKNEYLKYWSIDTLTELKRYLKMAVDHYNYKRSHYSLPHRLSPIKFENAIQNEEYKNDFSEWIYSNNIPTDQKRYIFENTTDLEDKLICPIIDN
jgi:hypothetical protein